MISASDSLCTGRRHAMFSPLPASGRDDAFEILAAAALIFFDKFHILIMFDCRFLQGNAMQS